MSRFRELTNNERFLLTILSILVVFWLSFKYIVNPQLVKISDLEEHKATYSLKIENNNRIRKDYDSIIAEINDIFLEQTNIGKDFFNSLNQSDIIYILDKLLVESDIETESLSFDKPFVEELNGQDIEKMDIIMPFNGNFKSLKEIIINLENADRRLVINNINIQKNEETEIFGNISLGVYSLASLVKTESANILVQTKTFNQINPFIPYEGYIDPNKVIEEENIEQEMEESSIESLDQIVDD